jgi:hypothetical protein
MEHSTGVRIRRLTRRRAWTPRRRSALLRLSAWVHTTPRFVAGRAVADYPLAAERRLVALRAAEQRRFPAA